MQWGYRSFYPYTSDGCSPHHRSLFLNPPILAFAATPPDENGYMNLSLGRAYNSRVVSQISTVIVEVIPSDLVNSDWNVHVSEVHHIMKKTHPWLKFLIYRSQMVERTIAGHIV
jgi:acyl-CoA hydrolase